MKKRTRHIVLLAGIPALTVLLFVASNFYHSSKRVENIRIKIEAQPDWMFLTVDDVNDLLNLDSRVLNQPTRNVNLQMLERELTATGFVDSATAYFGTDGQLLMHIRLRQPVARVMPSGVKGYYVDTKGRIIPLSQAYTARVPVLTGNVPDLSSDSLADSTLNTLVPMLRYMAENPYWQAHTSEIFRDRNGDLLMYPTLGDHHIEFGGPYNYEKKFRNLLHFYKTVLKTRGWNYYKAIALKYDGQIVATRK